MKKILSTLIIICLLVCNMQAQNLISSVPASANLVIKYAGENFKTLMPLKKVDSYSFIKNNLFKLIDVDTLTSVQNMGIDFEQDSYQYAISADSSLSFVTLLNIKNATQFLQIFKNAITVKNKVEQKNGYDMLVLSPSTYVGWTNTKAIIVNTTYQYKESYWDYKYKVDTATAVVTVTDTEVLEVKKDPPPPVVKKDGYKVPQKNKAKTKVTKKQTTTAKKKPVAKKKKYYDSDDVVISAYDKYSDSIENRKKDLWEQQEEIKTKKKQSQAASNIFLKTFVENVKSIGDDIEYQKTVSKDANLSLWVDGDLFLEQYQNYMSMSMFRYLRYAKQSYNQDTTAGFKSGVNVYFENDKIKIESKSYSAGKEMQELGKSIMESKQNPALLNYINPDNLGYASVSINSEAMMHYYYAMLKKYFASTTYANEYSDVANVYIDLLQIVVDEKSIADLLPGNYLFVMHSLDTKMVDYIDYTYDKEYKSKEVKKSKKELSPNFTFVMDTRKEDFIEKLARLPLKYTKKGDYNYKDKGGYYELAFDSLKYPISSLYFMIKDGKGIVTTSKTVINNTLTNTGFALDDVSKKSILSNNYAIKVDMKKILEITNNQMEADYGKKMTEYLKDNIGTIITESGYKDGLLQGTTTININGKHTNSLEFIFDMIQKLNDIDTDQKMDAVIKKD